MHAALPRHCTRGLVLPRHGMLGPLLPRCALQEVLPRHCTLPEVLPRHGMPGPLLPRCVSQEVVLPRHCTLPVVQPRHGMLGLAVPALHGLRDWDPSKVLDDYLAGPWAVASSALRGMQSTRAVRPTRQAPIHFEGDRWWQMSAMPPRQALLILGRGDGSGQLQSHHGRL